MIALPMDTGTRGPRTTRRSRYRRCPDRDPSQRRSARCHAPGLASRHTSDGPGRRRRFHTLVAAWMDGRRGRFTTSCRSALGSETATRHLSRSYPRRKRPPAANRSCWLMFPQVIHGVSTRYPQRNLWPLHRILSMRSICGSHSTRRLRQPGLFLLPRIPSRVSSPTPFFSAGGGPRRARRRTEIVPAALSGVERNPTRDATVSTIKAAFSPESICERDSASY